MKQILYILMLTLCASCNFDLIARKPGQSGVGSEFGAAPLSIRNSFPENLVEDAYMEFVPDIGAAGQVEWSASGLPKGIVLDANGKVSGYAEEVGVFRVVLTAKQNDQTAELVREVTVKGDPLVKYQWHVHNDGQRAFTAGSGITGQDLNARAALRSGATGKGVTVAVSDTGVAVNHPGLRANVVAGGSRDYFSAPSNQRYSGDPTPVGNQALNDGNAHGTGVAGIIAESRGKNFGGRGIAPEASLVGFNFLLNQAANTFIDQIQSYSNFPIDVFNQSWGFDDFAPIPIDPVYLQALRSGTLNFRNGKGAIYVRAAGNGYVASRLNAQGALDVLQDANGNFLSQSANAEGINANPYTLVVSAMNAAGVKASYSSTGSAVWVAGLGGEDGRNNPAVVTTDMPGCGEGFSHDASRNWLSGTMPQNPFEWGTDQSSLNTSCDYTSVMNGTSSAAPSVAGIVALVLQANPNLSWKDVFYILAKTASKVDAAIAERRCGFDVAGYVNEPRWVTNSAGFPFHNYYGFGRPDALKAVQMAKSFSATSPTLQSLPFTRNVNLNIPNVNPAGVTDTVAVNIPNNPRIFNVLLSVTSTHPMPAELAIELTSPAGTKSVVLNSCNSFVGNLLAGTALNNTTLRTNAFLDEVPNGNWQIRVIDTTELLNSQTTPTPHVGALTNWRLEFYY